MQNQIMQTAIYCRTASKSQMAVDMQKRKLEAYAKEHGYGNTVYYADENYSGCTFNRPAFRQMRSDIQSGKIGAVLSTKFSCLGRTMETQLWIFKYANIGIDFVLLDGPYGEVSCLKRNPFLAYMANHENYRRL